MKYNLKCAAMGGKWVKWNQMTERWEYLWVTHEHIQAFTTQWTETLTWMENQEATDSVT